MEFDMESEFLPDLGNEKDSDTVLFDLRVKRANESFMRCMNDVIKWKLSPEEHRAYPFEAKKNKSKYRIKMRKFFYDEKKGILYKQVKGSDNIDRRVQVIVDYQRQESLISACHSGLTDSNISQASAGHFGRDRMFAALSQRYSIPMLRQRIQNYIKYCVPCQMHGTRKLEKSGQELHSIPIPSKAWSQIGLDLIGPLKECNGKRFVVTCCDYFSKFIEAECIENKTGELVARFLYNLMCRYGVFEICITDQGREFCNSLVECLFNLTGIRHKVASSYHPQSCGLIERVNRSIEDVIRKTMTDQTDWVELLNPVLFACRVHKHASTGIAPFRMLYNRDATLPWEYADKQNNEGTDNSYSDNDNKDGDETLNSSGGDPLLDLIHKLDEHKKNVFETATKNIKKAQTHQAKCYKNRNSNREFLPGDKVLKRNMKDATRKEKFKKKFTGPYEVMQKTDNGSYILKDKYSHVLKRGVPACQLVRFHERTKHGQTNNTNSENDNENIGNSTNNNSRDGDISDLDEDMDDSTSCQRTGEFVPDELKKNVNSVQSQFVIISSNDNPMSSDESIVIDVGTPLKDFQASSVFEDIEIVEHLFNSEKEKDEQLEAHVVVPSRPVKFYPMTQGQRIAAAKRLNLSTKCNEGMLVFTGVGNLLKPKVPPKITKKSTGNGACLFNSLSILIHGTESFSYMIRHVICNYIADPINLPFLREHIPIRYHDGKMYLHFTGMRTSRVWGTDVELYSFAGICKHDVYVFTRQGTWARYGHVRNDAIKSCNSFYLDNSSGDHFDPVCDA